MTLLVRPGNREKIEREGIRIRCKDERQKPAATTEVIYQPKVIDESRLEAGYDLNIVSVRAQQLDAVLPQLTAGTGQADILFFGNNWWVTSGFNSICPPDGISSVSPDYPG